ASPGPASLRAAPTSAPAPTAVTAAPASPRSRNSRRSMAPPFLFHALSRRYLKNSSSKFKISSMRSYKQFCALAKALDVLGDRWTLWIVRELLIRGPSRYTELLDGLPGIATNLLVDRLRTLEQAGVVARDTAPPPVAATLFRLTERGEALE